MPELRVPLRAEQIAAANRLHARLEQWQASDRALAGLAGRFPGFDLDSSLLKAVTINALYGTNVFAVVRMAQHVTAILSEADHPDGAELVERIAKLPIIEGQATQRRHLSFASKFAHFFLDVERFPILDSYAAKMVDYHLGRGLRVRNAEHPYRAFLTNFGLLKQLAGWTGCNRELDHYLWIAGQYRTWRKNHEAPINAELSRLFAGAADGVEADLAVLLPAGAGDGPTGNE